MDGRRSSHPSSIHRMKTLSRSGRLPSAEAGTSGTCPCGRWRLPFLGWRRGAGYASVVGIDSNIKTPRYQLPGAEKGPECLGLAGGPSSRSGPCPLDALCLGGECAVDVSEQGQQRPSQSFTTSGILASCAEMGARRFEFQTHLCLALAV